MASLYLCVRVIDLDEPAESCRGVSRCDICFHACWTDYQSKQLARRLSTDDTVIQVCANCVNSGRYERWEASHVM